MVAVLDTGIHAELENQVTADGYDFIKDSTNAGDGIFSGGIDSDPTDNSEGISHGTHVSGTIIAASDNDAGVSGIAWNSRLLPIRVLGIDGSGTTFDVTQGLLYAGGLGNDSGSILNESRRADVINMSLGGGDYSQYLQYSINQVRANK